MSTPIVFAMLLVASVALNGEAATDLIINEISPVAPEGGHAWVEFYNPTPEDVILAGLVVGTAETEPFEVPDSFPSLQPGGYLVLRFGPGPYGLQVEDGPPQLIVFTAPSRLAEVWVPSRGEIMIERPDPMSTETLELVDYVAWGAQGAEWSRTPERLSAWREHSFVPLAEGFGIRDAAAELTPGGSIGHYPKSITTTLKDWVVFDPDETSPGGKNHVPRPKAFTLPENAAIGGQSFAVGWAKRKGDEWYRFELAVDESFDTVVVDERLVVPVIRIGEALAQGVYYYRVRAFSAELQSEPSGVMTAYMFTTTCDWPLPLLSTLGQWLTNPRCKESLDCHIIPTIEFKFQRKDSPLVCLSCSQTSSFCAWDSPHPYSLQNVCFLSPTGRPCYPLRAGGVLSKSCEHPKNRFTVWTPGLSFVPPESCSHGDNYCVMASISMMASAYRTCLSQDRIAYFYKANPESHEVDLVHGGDGGPSCGPSDNNDCSKIMRWALGIPEVDFAINPDPPSSPLHSGVFQTFLVGYRSAAIDWFQRNSLLDRCWQTDHESDRPSHEGGCRLLRRRELRETVGLHIRPQGRP